MYRCCKAAPTPGIQVAAAIQRKTVKQLLFDLSEAHLQELEWKGILPKGK
jgi:hypothetical protein